MKIIYEIGGSNIDLKKVEKIVAMSQDKYCGVSHSYKKAMEIEYEIKLIS